MNILHTISFYLFAGLAIFAGLIVVNGKNLFHNVIALALFFLTVGGLYFHLNAYFIALAQILVYVGGVIVLILFGIMLTPDIAEPREKQTNEQQGIALFTASSLCGLLIFILIPTVLTWEKTSPKLIEFVVLSRLLFSDYVLVINIIALIFLIAILGAFILAGPGTPEEEKEKS